MGCVMLHMELLRDLLSPQSRVHLIESPLDGVQLDGLHWQAITDVKEAEGLLQLATQNKAVHTMQADNGFLDACHIITAIKLTTLSPEGSSISMVELAAPPLPRPSSQGRTSRTFARSTHRCAASSPLWSPWRAWATRALRCGT